MTFRDLPFDKSGGLMHFLRPRRWRKQEIWQCSSVVEQRTHKPLVGGSNPPPATTFQLV